MDLGIAGRTAIVCASSKGLGRGCAEALAQAGCTVVINGRDAKTLEATAAAIRAATGATVIAVVADVSTKAGQDALLAAAPNPDILVNNNGGPPPKPFRQVTREGLLEGVVQNMATPLELVQRVIDGMIGKAVDAWTSATISEDVVIDVISHAAPTLCIRPPKFEARLAVQTARKMPCRNGARVDLLSTSASSSITHFAPAAYGFFSVGLGYCTAFRILGHCEE